MPHDENTPEQVEQMVAQRGTTSEGAIEKALSAYPQAQNMQEETERLLWGIILEQDGFITGGQARTIGVTEHVGHLVNRGVLDRYDRMLEDIDVFTGPDVAGNYWEAYTVPWLLLEPDTLARDRRQRRTEVSAALTGESALRMYEAGNLVGAQAEFIVTKESLLKRAEQIPSTTAVLGTIGSRDWRMIHGIPVLAPHLVVGQLAKEGYDGDHIGDTISDLIRSGESTVSMIAEQLHPYAQQYSFESGQEMTVMLAVWSGGVLDQARSIVDVAQKWGL